MGKNPTSTVVAKAWLAHAVPAQASCETRLETGGLSDFGFTEPHPRAVRVIS
jgi:hypothetical protein